ncbi:MAG: hypothetical protein ABR563_01610 [Pyrinomonadaceae bacterium]
MENVNQAANAETAAAAQVCAECLEAVAQALTNRRGETLCPSCAEQFFVACASCGSLVALDEALPRDGASYCADCHARPAGVAPEDVPAEEEVEQLVAEYVRLHAEESRAKARMDEIKERLKIAASARQRVANAVTLRGEDGAVKCSYRTSWKCDEERVAALENSLDAEQFASLFERSVKYAPVKEGLEKLLTDESADARLRQHVAGAVERSESATVTVVRPKKG